MLRGRIVGRAVLPFVLFWICLSGAIVSLANASEMRREELIVVAGGKAHTFDVEIALTDEQQMMGLMYRTRLGRREGMLFPYGKPKVVTMWMRNTYISLDMVFIKADGTVHRVERDTEPLSEEVISSGAPVVAVLELVAGVAAEIGIEPGSRIIQRTFFPALK
jgi:uncharacterized protein